MIGMLENVGMLFLFLNFGMFGNSWDIGGVGGQETI